MTGIKQLCKRGFYSLWHKRSGSQNHRFHPGTVFILLGEQSTCDRVLVHGSAWDESLIFLKHSKMRSVLAAFSLTLLLTIPAKQNFNHFFSSPQTTLNPALPKINSLGAMGGGQWATPLLDLPQMDRKHSKSIFLSPCQALNISCSV